MTKSNPGSARRIWPALLLLMLGLSVVPGMAQDGAVGPALYQDRGVELHLRRCLEDASRQYARALQLDPPKELSAEQWQLVKHFAPRLFTTRTEFFPLKDFAVILDPASRQIAYHLFWEDDIDFPEDNDPCDHEVVWVEYSKDEKSVEKLWTYFHGRILAGGAMALSDARQHAGRPHINVQWGKHGSMPLGWETLSITGNEGDLEKKYYPIDRPITLREYQQGTHKKLSEEGRRLLDNPIAARLGWPAKFTGSWADFTDFSRLVEPLTLLESRKMARVSRWNSATINQYFLTYNFRPKTEWPRDAIRDNPAPIVLGGSAELQRRTAEFQLPPKASFESTMPRYPNAWFYVDASLAPSFSAAVKLVTENLRTAMRLPEYYGPFSNPEACDFEVIIEHLQPWEARGQRPVQHSHAFHLRYYYSALERQKLERVKLKVHGVDRDFYRFGASVHYEVEHTNPNHADVELCPICGRTGEYANLKGNLVELVHDPLGLELLLTGKIRGETVKFWDWEGRDVGSVELLKQKYAVEQLSFPAQSGDKNTLRIGIVVITPK
ncbi:MAG: hypothetical protein ABI882_22480 [Acidobacteriota bacterium]